MSKNDNLEDQNCLDWSKKQADPCNKYRDNDSERLQELTCWYNRCRQRKNLEDVSCGQNSSAGVGSNYPSPTNKIVVKPTLKPTIKKTTTSVKVVVEFLSPTPIITVWPTTQFVPEPTTERLARDLGLVPTTTMVAPAAPSQSTYPVVVVILLMSGLGLISLVGHLWYKNR